jgi:hypothetical protein
MVSVGGASSSGLDLLAFLQPQKVTQGDPAASTGAGAGSQINGCVSPLGTNAAGDPGIMPSSPGIGSGLLDPNVMGFLIQNQSQQTVSTSALSPRQAALFAKLDTNGDGTISKSELEAAFGGNANTSADAVFNKLDTNGDGSVDPSELAAARPHRHHHHHVGDGDETKQASSSDGTSAAAGTDPASAGSAGGLASLLDTGGSSTTATNRDGSTVTTITYTDGSTITMTTPQQAAATTASGSTSAIQPTASSTNALETLIRLQAQLFSAATVAPPTV